MPQQVDLTLLERQCCSGHRPLRLFKTTLDQSTKGAKRLMKNSYKRGGYVRSVSEFSKSVQTNSCLVLLMTDLFSDLFLQ